MNKTPSTRRALCCIGALALSMLLGCALPQPADKPPPRYSWGQLVEFENLRFEFTSARAEGYFTNWVNQRTTAADAFIIVEVIVTNKTSAPLPHHFQPIFQLVDAKGAVYVADLQNTIMINMQKPGRLPHGQAMNPNTSFKQEFVFSAPRQGYTVQVIAPSRARVGFGGAVTSSGPYFLYDISSRL